MRIVTISILVGLVGLLTTAGLSSCGESSTCTPNCSAKQCGDDGCGSSCGQCEASETCSTLGQCVSCTPDCATKDCGDDGCDGSCGDCGADETCDAQGQCQGSCVPDCSGKVCGDDDCGGSCGTCPDNGSTCDAGQCVSYQPRSGVWNYEEWTPGQNNCNTDDVVTNGDGRFSLTDNGDGSFTVTPGDGGDPFDCDMIGSSFYCPERAAARVDLRPTFDVLLALKVTADGSLSSPQIMSGTQDGEAACTGADCALAATSLGTTFPCSFSVAFTARWFSD
jgi:hypothetical protein